MISMLSITNPMFGKTDEELRCIITNSIDAANNIAGFKYDKESEHLQKIDEAKFVLKFRKPA